ncbi:MAG TPA: hypothetical protein VN715_21710 [Roseiarcus sp.]|nr:hypothetical protein [Roseiarcus sp.]
MKALYLALGALCLAGAAEASPCAKQIAALEAQHKSGPALDAGSSSESVAALLHRQPTASSVNGAGAAADAADSKQAERDAHFEIEIEQAKAAEDSGDTGGCEAAVAEARKALAHGRR